MAIIFPASPSNNDTVVINGKKYIYKSADTAWQRDGAGTKYSVTSDEFDGDGSTTAFTLSRVSSTEATFVALNGIVQEGGIGKSYTVSNTTLTFATAPAVGERVVARNLVAVSNELTTDYGLVTGSHTGNTVDNGSIV